MHSAPGNLMSVPLSSAVGLHDEVTDVDTPEANEALSRLTC